MQAFRICFAALLAAAVAPTALAQTTEINLLYVHGVKNCAADRQNAESSLAVLEAAVNAELPALIASYEAAHPGAELVVNSARVNLYTAAPSGIQPSDSPDPLDMDDWEVGDPGCSTSQQGDPCTTAYEWRYRLAQEIAAFYPAPRRNIVLIGHSAGGRVSMEVAANVGTGGPHTHDWGVQSRIAGVVTLHGMVDSLGTSKYNVVGPFSFETGCKNGDLVSVFGSCSPGNGWCEYAGRVSGFDAADWVATSKRALMLTSWASCSPSAFEGRSDGSLPYDAQGSPWAVGLDMTPASGETWRAAHGQNYGAFCHSDLTNTGNAGHIAANTAAKNRILDWLFVAAPRVASAGSDSSPSIGFNQSTGTFTMGSACPAGEVDDTLTFGTKGPGVDVVGLCKHPGFFDGDDHAIALGELSVSNGSACNGTYFWTQAHDSSNNHAATFWWKTRSLLASGPELIGSLPTEVPTATPSDTVTSTPTDTATATATATSSATASSSSTATRTATHTPTVTASATTTATPAATATATVTATASETPTVTPTASAAPTATPVWPCPSAPRDDCRGAGRSTLLVRRGASEARDRLVWKLVRGASTDPADFGAPAAATNYAFCLYGAAGSLAQIEIPAGAGWTTAPGFSRYDDPLGTADGAAKILLRASDRDRTKLLLKGRGVNLPDFASGALTAPLIAQLANDDTGHCWDSRFDAAGIVRDTPAKLLAKQVN